MDSSMMLKVHMASIQKADKARDYEQSVANLIQDLQKEEYSAEIIQIVKNKARYLKNRFSEDSEQEKMQEAKNRLLEYLAMLEEKASYRDEYLILENYLKNFYLFLEAFREKFPDKRATLTQELLQKIIIENEYDLQHILYAVIKPMYPQLRNEISHDSEIWTVRSDFEIPLLDTTIEAKCTRKSMSLKKLIEEIEADIVHYQTKRIIFYIYDRVKLITDKVNFENHFNCSWNGTEICVIVQQPVMM